MLKMIVTSAVVSKGYNENPAIRFFEGEKGFQSVSFRIGQKIYDSRAENNHRWINLTVKGFGEICERIKKMKLKEGSYINLIARYDEDSWEDRETGATRTAPVLILDEIEYSSSGGGQKNGKTPTVRLAAQESSPPMQQARHRAHLPSGRGISRPRSRPRPCPQILRALRISAAKKIRIFRKSGNYSPAQERT